MKYVYLLNEYKEDDMVSKFGKKGAYLSDVSSLGLISPNCFMITTDACNQYYEDNQKMNNEILEQINEYLIKLEHLTGKTFGDINNPLLISIKCSSKNEIPNIIDTILNVGLTEEIVENLSNNTDEFLWIWECYFNFIKYYAKNIMGVELSYYEYVLNILNSKINLTKEDLKNFSNGLKKEYFLKTRTEFPDNSLKQLYSIIDFVFRSWNSQKMIVYRTDMDIPFSDSLSICIQSMVFGNRNKNSGTGTVFTRDPLTGDKKLTGNFSIQSLNTFVDIYIVI